MSGGSLGGFGDPVFSHVKGKAVNLASHGFSLFYRGGRADLAALEQLEPLLETAMEFKSIAHTLGIADRQIRLGQKATEKAVKTASLVDYRIVYFATHGLVTGEIKGPAEPALALSRPDKATAEDEGLSSSLFRSMIKHALQCFFLTPLKTIFHLDFMRDIGFSIAINHVFCTAFQQVSCPS